MFISIWHSILDMPKYDLGWHKADVEEELRELSDAEGIVNIWSEKSDVVYTYTRGKWSGHWELKFPLSKVDFVVGLIYMFPKYTLRWLFFYVLGKKINSRRKITEVRNPRKTNKLYEIAEKYGINTDLLEKEAKKLMRFWIFLK